ncbi:hypothetical protein IH980_00205 [Patescibacteria group bacterium]|nr:hypothetical protein [Patescibacteria group bacterium]
MRPESTTERNPLRALEFRVLAATVAEWVLHGHGPLLSPESQENLEPHREHLKTRSLAIFLNHFTRKDPFLVGALAVRELHGQLQQIAAPVGANHYFEFQRQGFLKYLLLQTAPLYGFEVFPVPRPNNESDYEAHITPKQRKRVSRDFSNKGRKVMGKAGGVFLITPEATRSADGKLQTAQPGVEHLEGYGPSVLYAPWAVIPHGDYNREQVGLVEINIGAPRSKEEIEREWHQRGISEGIPFKDILMYDLAAHLPPNMRGVYELPE